MSGRGALGACWLFSRNASPRSTSAPRVTPARALRPPGVRKRAVLRGQEQQGGPVGVRGPVWAGVSIVEVAGAAWGLLAQDKIEGRIESWTEGADSWPGAARQQRQTAEARD